MAKTVPVGSPDFNELFGPNWVFDPADTTFGSLSSGSEVDGQFPSGTGGSTDNFVEQQVDNLLVDMSVIHRQGNDYIPTISGNGVATYHVTGGPQIVDPDNGVFGANPNRAEWSFNFDISLAGPDSHGNPSHQTLPGFLKNHDIYLTFHERGTPDNTEVVLHAAYMPSKATGSSPVVWLDSHNKVVISDNGGNAQILANSENVDFNFLKPHGYNLGRATFDVNLVVAEDAHGPTDPVHIIADVHSVVIVGASPPAEAIL